MMPRHTSDAVSRRLKSPFRYVGSLLHGGGSKTGPVRSRIAGAAIFILITLTAVRFAAAQKQGGAEGKDGVGAQQSPRATLGLTPVTELGTDKYKGEQGGLYGEGRNDPPSKQLQMAMRAAAEIVPRDVRGSTADDGKIALVSIGMSNTTQEFSYFKQIADRDPQKSNRLVIVDGAQGGQDAADWSGPDNRFRKDRPSTWSVLDQRLESAGVTAQQVQAAWLKQARRAPAALGEFPAHAREFQGHLAAIVRMLKERFPNLRIVFLSSRIYAGYAKGNLNPEPYAYESAFAVRWLIQDQMRGDPELNCDPDRGEVKAPVLLWGPYLWGDGVRPRKDSGLTWQPDDLAADGTHPSDSGRKKVAEALLQFFKSDAVARPWFVK